MRVILLSDQRHLGRRGEVVDVKPGYGRNYLVPQGIALEATHANIMYFEQQRAKIDAAHAKNIRVEPWTVNDPELMMQYIEWGVDGIITDRPDLMVEVLGK